MGRLKPVLVVLLTLAALVGDGPRPAPVGRTVVRPTWQALALPQPTGPPGRLAARDAVTCDGRWFVVGAAVTADGASRPVAWSSTDTRTWSALTVRGDSYYGRQNLLYTAGCRAGQLAAVGAKSGGAHGNPRISAWWQPDQARLLESTSRELSGGAVGAEVARLTGGSLGWLAIGNGPTGATAWASADAARFDRVEPAPGLGDDTRGRTLVFDVVAAAPGWWAVGSLTPAGRIDPVPLAWQSVDGRVWTRLPVPTEDGYGELQRVALVGGTPVAVGRLGDGFGAWRVGANGWQVAGRFGAVGSAGLSSVRGLAVAGDQLLAAVSDGTTHQLWLSDDRGRSWREVALPTPVPAGGGTGIAVVADGDRVVLATDDGGHAALWSAGAPMGRA